MQMLNLNEVAIHLSEGIGVHLYRHVLRVDM